MRRKGGSNERCFSATMYLMRAEEGSKSKERNETKERSPNTTQKMR